MVMLACVSDNFIKTFKNKQNVNALIFSYFATYLLVYTSPQQFWDDIKNIFQPLKPLCVQTSCTNTECGICI